MEIHCPECGAAEFGTIEWVCGISYVQCVNPDGSLEYGGETKMIWDESLTVIDAEKHPQLHCQVCDHDWYEPALLIPYGIKDPYT